MLVVAASFSGVRSRYLSGWLALAYLPALTRVNLIWCACEVTCGWKRQ